jgi:hypothetical protein
MVFDSRSSRKARSTVGLDGDERRWKNQQCEHRERQHLLVNLPSFLISSKSKQILRGNDGGRFGDDSDSEYLEAVWGAISSARKGWNEMMMVVAAVNSNQKTEGVIEN